MIINKLEESERLKNIHRGFAPAFDFLKRKDIADIPVGTYEIDGKRIYAKVQEYDGRGYDNAEMEVHRNYIDIQYTVNGLEVIGVRHASQCTAMPKAWNEEKDVGFFVDKPDFWMPVPPGSFAIFFPNEDAHAPMAGSGHVRKIVIKVVV